ncbi:MAG: DUF4160 domain-containing protein [Pseudobdellovibrionaceae bacterium]|jgi:hypothetical protein
MHTLKMPTILLLANMIKITINPKDKHRFPHVHILHAEKSALIDLKNFEVLENNGFSMKTLKQVIAVIEDEQKFLLEAWREYND